MAHTSLPEQHGTVCTDAHTNARMHAKLSHWQVSEDVGVVFAASPQISQPPHGARGASVSHSCHCAGLFVTNFGTAPSNGKHGMALAVDATKPHALIMAATHMRTLARTLGWLRVGLNWWLVDSASSGAPEPRGRPRLAKPTRNRFEDKAGPLGCKAACGRLLGTRAPSAAEPVQVA